MYALTNAEMRSADMYTINELGVPSKELMRRAGLAVAENVAKIAKPADKILVVCGTGNNGGDGYVCAQALKDMGFSVNVYAAEGRYSDDCLREKNNYRGDYTGQISANIIVDCLFGTGLCRPVTGELAKLIEKINGSGATVVSADIPSGINGDDGLVCGVAVKADCTVAIAEYKLGHFLNDGVDFCGRLVKADIGITLPKGDYVQIYAKEQIKMQFPKRRRNSNKGTYGTAQIIAGSKKYMGAAVMNVEAALKSGCGYVKLKTDIPDKLRIALKFPQVIISDDVDFNADCIAIGSGCGISEELYAQICSILKTYKNTLIIDADGLNSLSKYGVEALKNKACNVILTPHVKEFSRLSGLKVSEILSNPVECAKKFSDEYGVTVLLKSSVSFVCGGGQKFILTCGNSALAKAGSGDMLTGFMCGTAARGVDPVNAAACASCIVGVAAEIASEDKTEYCVTEKDVIKNLHKAVMRLTD